MSWVSTGTRQYKRDAAPSLLVGSWGVRRGNEAFLPPSPPLSSSNDSEQKERGIKKKVTVVVWALRSNAQCHRLFHMCVTQQKSDRGKRQRSHPAAQMFLLLSNTQKACLLDGLCLCYFTTTPQNSIWHMFWEYNLLVKTRGLSVSTGNSIRITIIRHWGQGKHAGDTYKAVPTPFWISGDVRTLW